MFEIYLTILLIEIIGFIFGSILINIDTEFIFFNIFYKYLKKDEFIQIRLKYGKYFKSLSFISILTSILHILIEFFAFKFHSIPNYNFIGTINLILSIICFTILSVLFFSFIFTSIIKSVLPSICKLLLCTLCLLVITLYSSYFCFTY